MNKQRRKQVAELLAKLETLKDEVHECACEEREAFDNMPEGLQQSERGQDTEAAADALADALNDVESAVDALRSI